MTSKVLEDSLNTIKISEKFSDDKKLEAYYKLKLMADSCKIETSSAYSEILLYIGISEIDLNKNYDKGLEFIYSAFKINTKNNISSLLAAKCALNLADYYKILGLTDKALKYFDTTLLIVNSFPDAIDIILYSKLSKTNIFFHDGDFQKTIEESTSGANYSLRKKDTSYYISFLVQRALSFYYSDKVAHASSDADEIIETAKKINDFYDLASGLKVKALIAKKNRQFPFADSLFKEVIQKRIQTKNYKQIANDYTDYGNFFLDSLLDYKKAEQCYKKTIFYGNKVQNSIVIAKANINIGEIYLKQKKYTKSLDYCNKALGCLNFFISTDVCKNPSADKLNLIDPKVLSLGIIINKIKTLLELYFTNTDKNTLKGCLQTCMVLDTLITKMRYSQLGEESKLFWRDYTRNFYSDAIEASYFAKDPNLVFYFMEKSRAVLMNDKLNELNASSYLLKKDAAKQEDYKIKITELEQKISSLNDTSKQYTASQIQLINLNNEFEHYIKSLEQKYPAYYQYKYDDKVPSLKDLQQYLAKTNQSFVHYFFGDTATYILAVTAGKTNFIRLSQKDFNKEQLADFIKLCADKQALNNNYNAFAQLSNSIYKKIFQPLQLPKGRIIICTDNAVIPFDALCSDVNGKDFLLNNYSFSYVYSARSLMRQFNFSNPQGNFVGFAPVSFEKYLHVQDLKNAADALNESAAYYRTDKLFTHQTATRNNFFNYASSYSVVNIFSHARADTTDNEPVLFMQDSLIHLSELQLLNNPATQLVLLSACQTNVGKAATGEGIYSLARGFATAGIPSVSATLWKADEQAIYAISEKFNKYLSEGMDKDEALQKAKLDFIKVNKGSGKLLPYYWANMILIGNADALKLSNSSSNNYVWIIVFAAIVLIISIIFITRKKPIK